MSNIYQVIKTQQRPSKINGGYYYHITLQDIHSLEIVETSVDPAYKNFSNWHSVIKDSNRGQLIENVSVIERKGKRIATADSRPHQVIVCDAKSMNQTLAEWRQPPDLFEQP